MYLLTMVFVLSAEVRTAAGKWGRVARNHASPRLVQVLGIDLGAITEWPREKVSRTPHVTVDHN